MTEIGYRNFRLFNASLYLIHVKPSAPVENDVVDDDNDDDDDNDTTTIDEESDLYDHGPLLPMTAASATDVNRGFKLGQIERNRLSKLPSFQRISLYNSR